MQRSIFPRGILEGGLLDYSGRGTPLVQGHDQGNARKHERWRKLQRPPERTLGLQPGEGSEQTVAVYRSGGSTIVVYESELAGTNQATSAT